MHTRKKEKKKRINKQITDGSYQIMIATYIPPERMLFRHCDISSNF